ncbi:MAG: sugar phosphate isomerase/epimerase [Chthonomonadales bacterium]|nr:sugar phosphate isomerase/epimerase [Chthonomonadales bacterium]
MPHLATNEYPWSVLYARDGLDWKGSIEAGLDEVAASGAQGLEPAFESPDAVGPLAAALCARGLQMRSLYVSTALHEPALLEASLGRVTAIARAAARVGTRIVVTNPEPLSWSTPRDKDDRQLECQAAGLERLGGALRDLGLTLAYHNHDTELRCAARELHHMMLATDPARVALCLDAHWVYRGAGDSAMALFDLVALYGDRVAELHLRQSSGGVWSETFGPGDIDYARLASALRARGARPHLVLEQAAEEGTPRTLGRVEAQRRSVQAARELMSGLEAV